MSESKIMFRVTAEIEVTPEGKIKACNYKLDVSKAVDDTKYTPNGLPNAIGSRTITEVLCAAITSNIHMAHQKNYRDSAEHLRSVISKLEAGFIMQTDIYESEFNDKEFKGKDSHAH